MRGKKWVIAAFDVGQSTGIAVAEIVFTKTGDVDLAYRGSYTWKGPAFGYDIDNFVQLFDTMTEVWVEYPQPNLFSAGIDLTLKIASSWERLLDNLIFPVFEVQPGTWKASRAQLWNARKVFPAWRFNYKENRPTQHELDAFRIIYWRATKLKLLDFQA